MTHTTEGKQMTANLIERAKAALENTTPGPWRLGEWQDNVFGTGPKGEWLSICRVKRDDAPIEESPDHADATLISLAPDLARAIIREREAAEELAEACSKFNAAIDNPLGRPGAARAVMLSALAAYRKATKETDDV